VAPPPPGISLCGLVQPPPTPAGHQPTPRRSN
jgi:hypothetical protein